MKFVYYLRSKMRTARLMSNLMEFLISCRSYRRWATLLKNWWKKFKKYKVVIQMQPCSRTRMTPMTKRWRNYLHSWWAVDLVLPVQVAYSVSHSHNQPKVNNKTRTKVPRTNRKWTILLKIYELKTQYDEFLYLYLIRNKLHLFLVN